MIKNIIIGFLLFILLFLVPIYATNKIHRANTDKVIDNHAHSLLYIAREHKEMQIDIAQIQIDIARLIKNNDDLERRLEKRMKKCEAIIESFRELVKQKHPNFIKEGKEK